MLCELLGLQETEQSDVLELSNLLIVFLDYTPLSRRGFNLKRRPTSGLEFILLHEKLRISIFEVIVSGAGSRPHLGHRGHGVRHEARRGGPEESGRRRGRGRGRRGSEHSGRSSGRSASTRAGAGDAHRVRPVVARVPHIARAVGTDVVEEPRGIAKNPVHSRLELQARRPLTVVAGRKRLADERLCVRVLPAGIPGNIATFAAL